MTDVLDALKYVKVGESRSDVPLIADRDWYDVDTVAAYRETIAWIEQVRVNMADYMARPDHQLVKLALGGDKLALFVMNARQLTARVARIESESWLLAKATKEQVASIEQIQEREYLLETVRLLFTELLHQANDGKPMGIRWLKPVGDNPYRL